MRKTAAFAGTIETKEVTGETREVNEVKKRKNKLSRFKECIVSLYACRYKRVLTQQSGQ